MQQPPKRNQSNFKTSIKTIRKMKMRLIPGILIVIGFGGCRSNGADNNSMSVSDETERQIITVKNEVGDIGSADSTTTINYSEKYQSVDTIPYVYKSVIDSLMKMKNEKDILSYYFLYDITGNGIPEIWVKTGTCEADYSLNVYTITNGRPRQILDSDGGHIDFFLKGDTIGSIVCNTGSGYVSTYHYNGKKITKESAEFSTWNEKGKLIAIRKDEQKIIDIWEKSDTSLKFNFLK